LAVTLPPDCSPGTLAEAAAKCLHKQDVIMIFVVACIYRIGSSDAT